MRTSHHEPSTRSAAGAGWALIAPALAAGMLLASIAQAQATVGVTLHEAEAFPGYTLFSPIPVSDTYLIDNWGRVVHSWPGELGHVLVELLEDGRLLRTSQVASNPTFPIGTGGAGAVQLVDWGGTVLWEFVYSTADHMTHHDIEFMPNGNVLLMAWERKTSAEAIAAGRDPGTLPSGQLWPEHIIEVEPILPSGGNIVWQWNVWDHLVQDFDSSKANFDVVADHPELIDINYAPDRRADWLHFNALAYNEDLDQIMVSLRTNDELWIIDRSTTTAEAAGHTGGRQGKGGDLLYRWGSPVAYRHGTPTDRYFYGQHDARWIEPGLPGAGNILVFNNGQLGVRPYSSIEELVPPVDGGGTYAYTTGVPYLPTAADWTYTDSPTTNFFSAFISGAERQPNGNTVICEGFSGRLFEVTSDMRKVWQYINPVTGTGIVSQGAPSPAPNNGVFRAPRYPLDYPGLAGKELIPTGRLERYALLRNSDVTTLEPRTPGFATIFTATGRSTLDPARDDFNDTFASGSSDADPTVCDRPLTFYQVNWDLNTLWLAKDAPCSVRIVF